MSKYLKFSTFYFFCLYCIAYGIFTFIANYVLLDDALYYKSFGEILEIERVGQIIEQQRFFQKIGYGIIPIMLLLRVLYTTICFATGTFISEQKLTFGQCFNIAIKADVIFLIEIIIKVDYFSIFKANSLQEINIHFLSILQWFGINNIEQWLSYPMGILNIFELIYWILLALFLSYYTKKSFGSSLGFVAMTYGIGLLLWIVFIVYITLFLF